MDKTPEQLLVEGFVIGAQAMRDMLARFVETDSPVIAQSMRLNWNPAWGVDPGPLRAGRIGIIEFGGDGLRQLEESLQRYTEQFALAEGDDIEAIALVIARLETDIATARDLMNRPILYIAPEVEAA